MPRFSAGECPDRPVQGGGLPQGSAGRDEGGVAQPERHKRPLRVGGARARQRRARAE